MKQLLLICAAVALVGCVSTSTSWVSDPSDPNNVKIENAIRFKIYEQYKTSSTGRRVAKGKLTKTVLEKVTGLSLPGSVTDRLVPSWWPAMYYPLTNLKGLEKLTQLEELELYNNELTDVKGLEKLTKLKELNLDGNKLTDVTGLEKLDQLTWLNLQNNQLTSVKGLEKLTQLKELSLHSNYDLTKAQITELQKALPKCKITHNAK